jgi:hypothetical protein
MITLKEAYFIAKKRSDYPKPYVCLDLGECWQFGFVPEHVNSENMREFVMEEKPVGGGTPTVDKETGKYWEYHPTFDNFKLFHKPYTKIPIEELTKYDAEFESGTTPNP